MLLGTAVEDDAVALEDHVDIPRRDIRAGGVEALTVGGLDHPEIAPATEHLRQLRFEERTAVENDSYRSRQITREPREQLDERLDAPGRQRAIVLHESTKHRDGAPSPLDPIWNATETAVHVELRPPPFQIVEQDREFLHGRQHRPQPLFDECFLRGEEPVHREAVPDPAAEQETNSAFQPDVQGSRSSRDTWCRSRGRRCEDPGARRTSLAFRRRLEDHAG